MAIKVVKRGRGRPRKEKPSVKIIKQIKQTKQPKQPKQIKKQSKKEIVEAVGTVGTIGTVEVKRGRGRPRKYPLAVDAIPKKRGRPKKNFSYNSVSVAEDNVKPLFPLKIGKHIGYCPSCHVSLSTLDHIKNIDPKDERTDIFFCYRCSKEMKQETLLQVVPKSEPKYRSKKEYLEDCLKTPDDSHIPMHPVEAVSEDLSDLAPHPDVLGGE